MVLICISKITNGHRIFSYTSWQFVFLLPWNASLYILVTFLLGFFVTIQLLSRVWLFATQWPAAHQASLSFTVSRSMLKLMSIESVMPSNHLVLCCPLFLLPSILPRIKVFHNESALHGLWGSLICLIIFMFGQAPQSSLALKLGYPHISLYENPEQ